MTSWTTSLATLAAVVVGALLSFGSTRLTDRNRWQREEHLRWDAKRLDVYSEFASSVLQFTNTALRISAGFGGFATGVQPLDVEAGLPALAATGRELNVQWEQVLLLGSPDVILAAKDWQEAAFHLEYFARRLRSDPNEFVNTRVDIRKARWQFYSAARADLRIISGEIPVEAHGPGMWRTLTEPEPQAPTPEQ
jgi:hypothetical protein